MDTINRQTDELARLRDALAERETTLGVAQAENSELQLRASTTKHHCIIFGDAWIIETTHHRLKGTLPLDREGASLVAIPGTYFNQAGNVLYPSASRRSRSLSQREGFASTSFLRTMNCTLLCSSKVFEVYIQ